MMLMVSKLASGLDCHLAEHAAAISKLLSFDQCFFENVSRTAGSVLCLLNFPFFLMCNHHLALLLLLFQTGFIITQRHCIFKHSALSRLSGNNFIIFSCRQFKDKRINQRKDKNRSNCTRSEEHTSELQSRFDLVCRLL